jgi:hypothetical protein
MNQAKRGSFPKLFLILLTGLSNLYIVKFIFFSTVHLDVAKVSEVADPRRPGRSRIRILRVLDNKGDVTSQTFPKGKN